MAIRFGVFVFAVSLASGFIAGLGVKKAARSRILANYSEMRTLTSGLLAKSVNPLKLKKIWAESDKAEPAYLQTLSTLRKFLVRDPRLSNAFVVRFSNNTVTYVVDPGPVGKRSDGREVLQAKVGDPIDSPSQSLISTLKTGKTTLDQGVLKEPGGDVLRSYAALLGGNGKPVAAVCLDVKNAPLAHELEDIEAALKTGIISAFGFSLLLGVISGMIVRRLRAAVSEQSTKLGRTEESLAATVEAVRALNDSLVSTLNAAGCLIWQGNAKVQDGRLIWAAKLKHESPFAWIEHQIASGDSFDYLWESLRDPEDDHLWQRSVKDAITKKAENVSTEYRICRENGDSYWFSEQLTLAYNADGSTSLEAFVNDISETRARGEEVRQLAFFDTVTGLINRTKIHEVIGVLLSESPRMGVVGIEISNFRNINESWGAEIGDKLLKGFGATLSEGVAAAGIVGRLAGDDFVVIVPDPHAMSWIVGKIDELCQKAIYIDGVEIAKMCRIGYVQAEEGETATGILRKANLALENARKNQSIYPVIYKPEMSFRAKMRVELETAMRQALTDGEFHLVFQPIYCNKSRRLVKAEALLRWNSSRFGQVSPATFIPIAEESDIINDLGNYVLDETAKAIKKVIELTRDDSFAISMNLSLRQLKNTATLNAFSTAVDRWGITTKNLVIEVTESSIMHDAGECLAMLVQLQDRGFSLAIDDFGTGYSSLATLASLPFDILKIDKRFVDGIAVDKKQEEVIGTIIRLARALNLQIVAEGIETEPQFEFLASKEVEYSQGYFFSKPLPLEDLVMLAQNGNDLAA
ncbi:MAG: EAL domain-containing protein [Armatimonadota bacterium]